MRFVTAFLLLTGVSAFTSPLAFRTGTALSMSTVSNVPIIITGNNIVVTEALTEYINKKLERPFGKLRSNGTIKDCEVHLSVSKNPKVRKQRYPSLP
jgi:Sigma 54 modulation protein / S30EA ribosomal protein